jgi:hypothetical protein
MLNVAKDPKLAEDIINDHSHLKTMVISQYVYKTIIISTNMVLISYFLGIFYYIYADIFRSGEDNFIIYYEVNQLPPV